MPTTDASGPADIEIRPLSATAAARMSAAMAEIDPWRRLGITAPRLAVALNDRAPDVISKEACLGGGVQGLISIRLDWLFGPYIRLLAVLPDAQGRGIGRALISHACHIARQRHDPNIWVCASAFNHDAISFYEREGFVRIGCLEELVARGEDEILLRRRLTGA